MICNNCGLDRSLLIKIKIENEYIRDGSGEHRTVWENEEWCFNCVRDWEKNLDDPDL